MTLSNTFRQPILLTNMETEEAQEFTSMTEAGKYLGVSRVVISQYLKENTQYKGYQFYKISSETVLKPSSLNAFRQPVLLTNVETGLSKEFSTLTDAAEYLDISRTRLSNYLKKLPNEAPS